MTRRYDGPLAAATLAAALAGACALASGTAHGAGPQPVVVAGVVPDEATRQQVLARLHAVFGADGVEDRIAVGGLAAPVGWGDSVVQFVGPALRRIRGGRLDIGPADVAVSGEVAGASDRDVLLASLSRDGYRLRDDLRLGSAQSTLDAAVAGRSVEFEPGAATLTPNGERLLAELLPRLQHLQRLPGRGFEIVGHTDAAGPRDANLALSRARADTVEAWLAARGIAPERITTRGAGPDQPVADNASAAGRARNRRIEFRVVETRQEAGWTPPR